MSKDTSFQFNDAGLKEAVDLLGMYLKQEIPDKIELPATMPETGAGEHAVLRELAPMVIGGAAKLGTETALGYMDPPTPWISWATTLWNAALNQNLLHPTTSPVAREIELTVMRWLSPYYGMGGGQVVPGSTLANLTALWAAREIKKVKKVVASSCSHLSIRKAAHILGLEYVEVEADDQHRMRADRLGNLRDCALVITAGTTTAGAIDALDMGKDAAWRHVDAAWAGPLQFSNTHKSILAGIEQADSIAISAHKWLFQPKESALVLFKDWHVAEPAISFGGSYLAVPNTGILGSHGATAVPLLATLMAWGRKGIEQRIDVCMNHAATLTSLIEKDSRFTLFSAPESGVVVWKPVEGDVARMAGELKSSMSSAMIGNVRWLRSVAANPNADPHKVFEAVCEQLEVMA